MARTTGSWWPDASGSGSERRFFAADDDDEDDEDDDDEEASEADMGFPGKGIAHPATIAAIAARHPCASARLCALFSSLVCLIDHSCAQL
jgi:hypothetical protein